MLLNLDPVSDSVITLNSNGKDRSSYRTRLRSKKGKGKLKLITNSVTVEHESNANVELLISSAHVEASASLVSKDSELAGGRNNLIFKNNDCVSPGGPVESINGQLKLLNLDPVFDPVTEFFLEYNGLSATNEASFNILQEKAERLDEDTQNTCVRV